MADLLQAHTIVNPITALTFLDLDRLYLLAGEGPFVRVFNHATNELLRTIRIFEQRAVHGITCSFKKGDSVAKLLIWGGSSVCVLETRLDYDSVGNKQVFFDALVSELHLHDWVFDGCFEERNTDESTYDSSILNAFLITGHNELLSLDVILAPRGSAAANYLVRTVASGESSQLFSAHLKLLVNGQVLIAAGSAKGETWFWSYLPERCGGPASSICHVFHGHEGAVFGVQISEMVAHGHVRRVLASCSDDRTIRLWDISRIDSDLAPSRTEHDLEPRLGPKISKDVSELCLFTAMGHASRIWGVRFLGLKDDCWGFLSYGEDATAQTWLLCPQSSGKASVAYVDHSKFAIQHQATYKYHFGKSIRAVAIHYESTDSCLISTGGADGRITSYYPDIEKAGLRDHSVFCRFTREEVSAISNPEKRITTKAFPQFSEHQLELPIRQVFDTLEGNWQLSRTIRSHVTGTIYGTLEGTATFVSRTPEKSCEAEYIYSETGVFVNVQGLKSSASRRYIYQYHKSRDAISVWFVKTDDNNSIDYLNHELKFSDKCRHSNITAKGYHYCGEDLYEASYRFALEESNMNQWELDYKVDGPTKDYIASSNYKRNYPGAGSDTNIRSPMEPGRLAERYEELESDGFKIYAWLTENEFLVSTEQGNLLLLTTTPQWAELGWTPPSIAGDFVTWKPNLRAPCIITSIVSMRIALITGFEGTIYLYQHSGRRLSDKIIWKAPQKLVYLKAHELRPIRSHNSPIETSNLKGIQGSPNDSNHSLQEDIPESVTVGVVSRCMGSAWIHVMLYRPADWRQLVFWDIELNDNFTLTSSFFFHHGSIILVLGSRSGELALCKLPMISQSAMTGGGTVRCMKLLKLHQDAITSIGALPNELGISMGCQVHFFTTGRDGNYKIHELTIRQSEQRTDEMIVDLKTVHECTPRNGLVIEGACFNTTMNNFFLWGFHSKSFVVLNDSKKTEVMSVECKGGHRNWDYYMCEDGLGGGSFVWTQASLLYVHRQRQASHSVIHSGGHGREIKAMALSPTNLNKDTTECRLVATGAEDTTIRIHSYMSTREEARVHSSSILTEHTTGIQQLRWSEDGNLLFSAAGCEEFFVWRTTPIPYFGLGIILESRCPVVTDLSDLRIMDFEVFLLPVVPGTLAVPEADLYGLIIVYSDSTIRFFSYCASLEPKFQLLSADAYKTNCLTQVRIFLHVRTRNLWFCTASTDGHLALWRLDFGPARCGSAQMVLQGINRCGVSDLHQSSIQSVDVLNLSSSQSVIVTGGDDGGLHIAHLMLSDNELSEGHPSVKLIASLPKAHSAAVTAVKCIAARATGPGQGWSVSASVGTDQRLKVFVVYQRPNGSRPEIVRVIDAHTNVADASSLEMFKDGEGRQLAVAGIGMEVSRWKLDIERIISDFEITHDLTVFSHTLGP